MPSLLYHFEEVCQDIAAKTFICVLQHRESFVDVHPLLDSLIHLRLLNIKGLVREECGLEGIKALLGTLCLIGEELDHGTLLYIGTVGTDEALLVAKSLFDH